MMKILMLAPQPFYQARGTPIAVNMVLQVLSQRGERVDVITFFEGEDVHHPNVKIYRTPKVPFLRNIRPGFSWQKVICDGLMLVMVLRFVLKKRYHLIHAVEESVFIALLLKVLFRIPYIYDMDSSIAQQMIEKYPKLAPLAAVLHFFEGIAVKYAEAVVPVCDALAQDIRKYNPKKVVVIPDTSLIGSTTA
jgi:hypothetical protein